MLVAASNRTTFTSIRKRFTKYGKKMKKQRMDDFTTIRERLSEIAEGERTRSREILESHRAFFVDEKKPKKEEISIDLYEK